MRYLHTMVRISDVDASLHFYRDLLGLNSSRPLKVKRGALRITFYVHQVTENATMPRDRPRSS